jgi:hypothetical protein
MSDQKPGDLVIGKRYRIVAIDPDDDSPSLKIGDVVECAVERSGCIEPRFDQDGFGAFWFADYQGDSWGTLVSAVEEA